MGWSAQDIEKLRKQNNGQKSTAGTGQSAAPKSTTAPARSSGSTGWSAEKIDALRTGSGTKQAAKSTDAWVNRSAGTSVRSTAQKAGTQSAGKSNQNPTSGSLSAQVLGQMTGTQSVQTTKKAGSKLPTVERTGQPEWLGTGKNSAPAAKVLGTGTKSGKTYAERNNAMPMQSASGAMASAPNAESVKKQIKDADAKRVESWYARDAQQLKQETEELKATDKFSDFDRLNQWMDADPKHRELVALLRMDSGNEIYAERSDAMKPTSVSGAMASAPTAETSTEKREYTDAELLAKGYSRKQIHEARQYIADFDALPDWQRAARRTSNTIGGIVDTVASAPLMAGETAVRSVQNAVETGKNWNELQESVKSDNRQWKLLCLMTGGKTQYAGRDNAMQPNGSGVMAAPAQSTGTAYTDEELKAKGYSQSEIDRMRARISGAKVSEGIDPEKSLGYQMYKRGQQLNEAAQAGMSPLARQLMGVTTSAAENLAVAGISPALVLPVLSAQGGAESMGQSIEKGESAGKTLAGGLAKFGAGWAINSVGAADLARTMGSDYAKDTLAGKLADMVRSVADNGVLAQQYPTIANTISGGVDNAMQAFVETYADKAIDAALGDEQAAQEMFNRDTFLTALESGLTGGASGALGGAVGTQLGRMSAALEAEGQTGQRNGPSPSAQGADSSPEGEALGDELPQPPTGDSSPERASLGLERQTEAQKMQSSNPAVQQLAEAMDSGTLTSRTIKLFTPNAANEANRAAFAEAYGMELPETAAQTRQVLRQMEAERSTAQSAQEEQQEPEAVQQEQTGELQGSGREIRDGVMTTWNPDGTVETQVLDPEMAARTQAEQQAQAAQKRTVENTGETVETPAVSHSLDSSRGEGAFAHQAEPAALRETAGLEVRSEGAQKSSVQRELLRWKVSEGAAQTLSRNMPAGIADESRYAAAASSLYRLGQMEDVTTFDKAMELAKGMNGLAVNTDYVLAQPGGAAALKIAWLQGKGEAEAGAVQTGTPGGALSEKSVSGSGRVLYKGTMRTADEVATKLIELNARATDTDAVLKAVLEGDERVKAYVDTAAGQIFFADSAGDVFGTVLHEDWHWYNALNTEGAKAVQQHVMEYLAKSEGFENIDELIRNKLSDYAQQGLTYGEAAEEMVADAWRGIFDSEESFKRWVEFQRGQAEKNAGRAGTIRKVMNAVKDLLSDIVSRAKEVLAKHPENRAALKAQRLAEAEKRALQDEYFAHAEKAMDNLRAAKENAAALKSEGAAQGVRFQLHEGKDSLVEQMNGHLDELEEMKPVATIEGTEVSFGKTRNENISNVEEFFDSIGNKVIRENFGTVELTKSGARATVQHGNSKAKQVAVAAVPEVIQKGKQIGYEQNWQGRGYDTYVFAAPVEIDGTKLYEGVIVREYTRQNGMKNFYVHEVCWTDGSYVTFDTEGNMTKKEDTPTQLPKAVRSTLADAQEVSSDTTIAQTSAKSKENNAAVQKNVRYQLAEQDELAKLRTEQQQLTKQRSALKEERSAWLNSAEVQRIEAKKKALGVFSAEGKAYRDSAEYQDYLAKRKEYNSRLAALEERDSALTEQMKAANERLQQRKDAQAKDAQNAYNARAKAYGGNAEYRRMLAKEQFGVTEEFRRAGYILPDGQMLDFAQNDRSRDTDHREILEVFGPAEVKNGTEALNEFLLDGNVRVMAEAPGVDISADTAPTAQQLEQIRKMAEQLSGERGQFTLDISTADGRVAASKEYSGRVDADKVVREIRDYYRTGELAQESELARFRYQLAEQASRDAKRNEQQQASRVIAEKAAALDTLSQFFGLTRGVTVSRSAVEELAGRWLKVNGSKTDRAKLAEETEVLVNYLKADGADMEKAEALAETLAGEIQDGAMYRNSELWDEYPELHKLEYTVNRNGQAKAELVKRYGSWSEAVAEARRHGVALRQAEGVRDGNPAEQYESLVNDDRAVGGVTDGAKALWKQAAEQAGVAGSQSFESTEWLDVLMNLHDAIKPKTMSRFADKAEYEDARVELAGRIIGDIMQLPQLTDAEAIFEGIQRHNLEAAKAAAGDAARAAEVEKGLRGVQKVQSREFNRRLAENQRTAGRNAEVQHVSELQKRNAKAEKQLDANLELLGVDVSNVGDLNEKLTVLRETYEREWKAERKRMRTELQQMRDEARLEVRQLRGENADLARQVRDEQRRADKAEYSLIVQENEIMEWEEENQRKAEAWQQKQAQRNALAAEVARQQRDEEIAIAKRVAEKRVQKARDGRKMDELKRGIRQDAAALNQMVLRQSKGKYVSQRLIVQAAEVAKIADMTVLNDRAVNQLTRLQNSIQASMGSEGSPTAMTTEWEQTGVPKLITALQTDLTAWKDAKLADLQAKLAEAEALPYSEKALALQERLRKRIRETESRTYLPMTVDQMRMLKAITSATLHVIRNENKTVSLAKAEEVSKIADEAAYEVTLSKGNHPGGALDGLQNLLTKYNLDMLGAERVLRMLGGYKNGGQMEKIGQMLNDGQYRQTKITIEGEKLFADVTGAKHAKEAQAFAGPGADLVDVGLRDTDHNAVPLTHAQLCSLYMHLQNKDSREHLMTGGMVVPDAQLYSKGDVEQAYQKGQLVQLGMLSDGHGEAMADTILNTLEAAMTDYDRAWCADMKEFFGNYTTKLINETSLQLVGYKRATVQNYYPIAVDKAALATEIDGVKLDATIEGRGFLKNRVKSSKPILLEECSSVVQRSLRDTAAYAGLAAPIRDVQKILNAGVETRDGVKTLKNGVIKEQWGTKAVSYLDDLLTDLQTTQRHRSNGVSRMLSTLRGNYAGAVLTLNPGVAIAQAASLPTAAAVLGGDTMAAVVPFVKNLSPKQKAALEAEIAEHGDVLLQWRQRGTGKGELQSIGKRETLVQKGMDKVPGWLTGWINGMDEITVAALWEGSKAYVKNHAAEFEGAGETGSPAYWEAVNRTYQKVIEQTQPNYTVMQRAGIQRNPDEMVKTFTMFTTQRFQNAGILIDAVGDWKAQAARYKADASDANKAELQRATKQRDRAILSQAAQVAVFAMMKIGADFLLHRWDREQDENGDVTLKSMVSRFFSLSTESTMGNFLWSSELYSLIDNAIQGKDYDVISATNISAVNDMASDVVKFTAELKKDTSEMDEAELEKHHKKLMEKGMALIENGFEIVGVPYGNGRKMVDAVRGYWDDAQNVAQGGKFSFNSLPESATGQYDRLYNAYASGDADEAQAAVEKLVAMGKEDEIYKQLKTRLVKYDKKVEAAAKARNAGDDETRVRLTQEIISDVYDVMGIRKNVKEDAERRSKVIDMVTGDNRDGKGSEGAINVKADALLKGDAGDMYADLSEAVDSRKAQDVQAEYDRLMKAGRTPSSVKSKLTELAKPEYLAGSDADKQQLADVLLALTDTDGNALYTEKTFAQWEKAAEKAAQAEPEEDPYALLR
ncbi:LPD3 domain-containing protein [Faecalibacterium duncaniae]